MIGAGPTVRLRDVLTATAILGVLVAVWLLVSDGPRGAGDALARPEFDVEGASAPQGPQVELVTVGAPADTRSAVDADDPPSGTRGDELDRAAAPPAEAETAPPASPPPQRTPRAPPAELCYVLRVLVRADGAFGATLASAATVTFDFGDAAARISGTTPLYRTLELQVVRPAKRPLAGKGLVLVDHPGFPPVQSELDLERARRGGRDEEGRTLLTYELTVVLQRGAAVLVGRAQGADLVALAEHSAARAPGALLLADVTSAAHGEYRLRVPRAGDWVVIAMRESAHPSYAIVEVPPAPTARGAPRAAPVMTVEHTLAPHETVLAVQSSHPRGYDPSGIEALLVPYDQHMRDLGLDGEFIDERKLAAAWSGGGFGGAPPYLTWHRTYADPVTGEPWGQDLRSGGAKPERRDSIARFGTRATLDGAGNARIIGGATGAAIVLVKHPFRAHVWFVDQVGDVAANDRASVLLPVARLDVRGIGQAGPLAGGVASAAEPRAQGWLASTTLDEHGVGQLFVPSSTVLTLEVRGAGEGGAAQLPLTTPPPGGTRAVDLEVIPEVPPPSPAREPGR